MSSLVPQPATPIMCVANQYLWKDMFLKQNPEWNFVGQESTVEGDRKIDRLKFENEEGESTSLSFDVTAFFGKFLNVSDPDMPPINQQYTFEEFLGEEAKELIENCASIGLELSPLEVHIEEAASQYLNHHATLLRQEDDKLILHVFPLREYCKESRRPILHGYQFWRMMFEHDLQHFVDLHRDLSVGDTHVGVRGDENPPVPGVDCVAFKELPSYNFANDLLNYTFYTHTPEAFRTKNYQELNAFGASLQIAIKYNLFSKEELLAALDAAETDEMTHRMIVFVADCVFAGRSPEEVLFELVEKSKSAEN